jgi:hypothetical protein
MDKQVTPEISETPELPKSSIITDNAETKLEDNEYCDDNCDTSCEEQEDAFTMAFTDSNFDTLDKLDSYKPLDDYFPVVKKVNAPTIEIKDKDYEFNVDPEIIEKAEKVKFYGRDDDFPFEHITHLHELSVLFGKDESHQSYYFLKLFPFSLGGSAKSWYNGLKLGSITSKEREDLPQAWGRFGKMVRKCPTHGFNNNK